MLKFTIRELIMLTTIVALACGWTVERVATHKQITELRSQKEYAEKMRLGRMTQESAVESRINLILEDKKRLEELVRKYSMDRP